MARTALTVQLTKRAGLTPSYAAANVDGHSLPADGRTMIHVKTGATGCTVQQVIPKTVDGQAVPTKDVVIGTSSERMIGPYPAGGDYDQGDGTVNINFTSVATVTIAAIKVE